MARCRSYKEIDWPRLEDRYARWWRGELETPIFYIATQPHVELEPRPREHEAVRKWFMDPDARIPREVALNKGRWYYADGFPTIDIARINIGQAAFYGCPTNFTRETIWVGPIVETWEEWPRKLRYDPGNELWQLTLAQAHKALELAEGDMAITIIGGFDGVFDNLSTVRGVERALMDVLERPEEVVALEKRFLSDFGTYYFTLYDILKENRRGISLWNRAPMTEGPAHCMQSDFSCMISPKMYQEYGRWYLEEQAGMFATTLYHLDGTNALQHLPMLCQLEGLDGIQFTYQIPDGKRITELIDVWKQILGAGKRVEIWAQDIEDVLPLLEQVPPKGLKLNLFPRDRMQAETLVEGIERIGYPVD